MVALINRPSTLRTWMGIAFLIIACHLGAGAEVAGSDRPAAVPAPLVFPVDERLSYAISWSGIHCGEMEITSFIDKAAAGAPMYRIVVLTRTTNFFDGIYRLRSRLDSYFDPRRMTSLRYDEKSLEKKKRKDESWIVDLEAMEIVKTKNGEETRFPVEVDRANDPLAFIYRLRMMGTDIGDENVLGLMTSKGAVETVARVTGHKQIRTKMGKCDAASVVPEPRDKMMFSKSGSMVVWIDREPPHRPCKIDFDLSFGTLTANLKNAEVSDVSGVVADWENWEGSKGEDR